MKTLRDKVDKILKKTKQVDINALFYANSSYCLNEKLEEVGIELNFVDRFGGEDEGEKYWSIYSFSDGQDVVYVKFDGFYQSYSGAEFNRYFFVQPKKVEVTQYFEMD